MKPDIFHYGNVLFPNTIYVPMTDELADYMAKFAKNIYNRHDCFRTMEQVFENVEACIIEVAMCQALGIPFDYNFEFKPIGGWEYDVKDTNGVTFQVKRFRGDKRHVGTDFFLLLPDAVSKIVKNKSLIDYVATGDYTKNNGVYAVDISMLITIQSFCDNVKWSVHPKTKDKKCYNHFAHKPPDCYINPRLYVRDQAATSAGSRVDPGAPGVHRTPSQEEPRLPESA